MKMMDKNRIEKSFNMEALNMITLNIYRELL